jgi:hypothetical protein
MSDEQWKMHDEKYPERTLIWNLATGEITKK